MAHGGPGGTGGSIPVSRWCPNGTWVAWWHMGVLMSCWGPIEIGWHGGVPVTRGGPIGTGVSQWHVGVPVAHGGPSQWHVGVPMARGAVPLLAVWVWVWDSGFGV